MDPKDIDALVVGHPDRADLFDAAERAERALGREVSIRSISPTRWSDGDDPFLRTLRSRPLVALDIGVRKR